MRETLSKILRDAGYDVASANDAQEAIAKVKESGFFLIFMDIVLPDMNGVEAYKVIKKISPRTTTVMITGYLSEHLLVKEAIREGAYSCLYKPFGMEEFLKVVKKIMPGGKK